MKRFLQKFRKLFFKKDIYDFINKDEVIGLEHFLKNNNSANKIDEYGQTPIFRILYNKSQKQYKMLEILLKYGADVNFKRNDNTTPIFFAKKENAILLINNGADIFQISNHNTTPLFYCSDIPTLKYFLSLGLNINHKDNYGETILHNLIYNDKNIVEFAVENNADVNAQSFNGTTPLISLAKSEHRNENEQYELIEIAEILLKNGANAKHSDNMNLTVFDYCNQYQNFVLEDWLKKHCG